MVNSTYIPYPLQCQLDNCFSVNSLTRALNRVVKVAFDSDLFYVRHFVSSDGFARPFFTIYYKSSSDDIIVLFGSLDSVVSFLDGLFFSKLELFKKKD